MRIKTIAIIVLILLLAVVLLQNSGPDTFTIFFVAVHTTKFKMLAFVAITAFLLGVLIARPKKPITLSDRHEDRPDDLNHDDREYLDDDSPAPTKNKSKYNTLSDEDRDYLN